MRGGKASHVPDASEYGRDFGALAALLRAKCGGAAGGVPRVAGTDQDARSAKDVADFLDAANGSVQRYVWHHYLASHATVEQMTDPAALDGTAVYAASLEPAVASRHARQWVGETSGSSNGGTPNVSDRYVDGVWWVDQLGALASHGVVSQMRQSILGADYGVLRYDAPYDPVPSYFGGVLWKRLMGTTALAAASTTRAVSVRAYAHCHPTLGAANGTVSVALVNVHPTATVDVQLGSDAQRVGARALSADHASHPWRGARAQPGRVAQRRRRAAARRRERPPARAPRADGGRVARWRLGAARRPALVRFRRAPRRPRPRVHEQHT
jgi:hypothetical protein